MNTKLIAPCGMNCALCIAYIREKNQCPGCRKINENGTSEYRKKCTIANCEYLKESGDKYCSPKCKKYPCRRLKQLDKRYRTKYGMSMIENLENIKERGVRRFVEKEKKKWKCPSCGKTLSVHRKECLFCGNQR